MGATTPEDIAHAIGVVAGLVGLDDTEKIRYVDDERFRDACIRAARAQFDIEELREQTVARLMRRDAYVSALETLDGLTIDPATAASVKALFAARTRRPSFLDFDV